MKNTKKMTKCIFLVKVVLSVYKVHFTQEEAGDNVNDEIQISDLAGVYKELAEIIGVDVTIKLHKHYQGVQITFPKKLYSIEYVRKRLGNPDADITKLSGELGYTTRRLRQIKNMEVQNG